MDQDKKETSYVLFGTGEYYQRYRHWFRGRRILALLDNDREKQGTVLDGYPVLSPEEAAGLPFDAAVILSFCVAEMKGQLVRLGVSEDRIYHFYDLRELFRAEGAEDSRMAGGGRDILLLSHDLSLGGPALALYHAALVLRENGYGVTFASMLDGALRERLEERMFPVMVDRRLQLCTMRELPWTGAYGLIICNTVHYHTFLLDRDEEIPVIWWLHDSAYFYGGIREGRLAGISRRKLKYVSAGPVPGEAMRRYCPDAVIGDLIYGVSEGI